MRIDTQNMHVPARIKDPLIMELVLRQISDQFEISFVS